VRKATVEYHAPARYDDDLLVCGRAAHLGRSSVTFTVSMFRADDTSRPLVDVELVYVCVDRRGVPAAWPQEIRDRMHRHEAVAPAEEPSRG
jgi:acyl-CoA thioester hydrolase